MGLAVADEKPVAIRVANLFRKHELVFSQGSEFFKSGNRDLGSSLIKSNGNGYGASPIRVTIESTIAGVKVVAHRLGH
jgi:hypothetical protein